MKFKEMIDALPGYTEAITLKIEGEKGDSVIYPFGMIAEKFVDADIVKVDWANDTICITILPEEAAAHEA